ncbi:MAG: NYN domain-containing protein [Anaerolineaceae bacterium]|nr:NYN domain-containing protein [Anaerolineaceae bacterium]
METIRRLALMIDGDNAQAELLPQMIDEVSKYGIIMIRRVYGDWSKPHMNSWHDVIHSYALRPEQQFGYTKGKNATDIALTIGAMDFLHKSDIEGFCIVSSDSDFTPLVNRIRENNLFVIGVGKKTAPEAFIKACNVFIFTDIFQPAVEVETTVKVSESHSIIEVATETTPQMTADSKQFRALFRKAFAETPQVDGWAQLAILGQSLLKLDPEYKRTYKIKGLSYLAPTLSKFIETEVRNNKKGNEVTYVRLKQNTKTAK